MGTNYYIREPIKGVCEYCGGTNGYEELHIGKSSGGWKFLFNPQMNSFKDVQTILEKSPDKIFDEYGRKIRLYNFYKLVEIKQSFKKRPNDWEYYTDEDGYEFSNYSDFS